MLDFRLAVFLKAKMSGTPTKLIRELFQCQGRGVVQDIKQAYTKNDNMNAQLKKEKYKLLVNVKRCSSSLVIKQT